eukprot:GHVO01008711.1.p3 GENE.GHVO01008711.1~~GHVO01008711.1.p3  ORF type:complete len:108 (-),score=10.20 GHVO01008711.1:1819-2142(-)
MSDGNKDVEIYERVAALETQLSICMPQIDEKLAKIDTAINDGLKTQVKSISGKLDTHITLQNNKDLASKDLAEKKAKRNTFWMVLIRSVIVGTCVAAWGILLNMWLG